MDNLLPVNLNRNIKAIFYQIKNLQESCIIHWFLNFTINNIRDDQSILLYSVCGVTIVAGGAALLAATTLAATSITPALSLIFGEI